MSPQEMKDRMEWDDKENPEDWEHINRQEMQADADLLESLIGEVINDTDKAVVGMILNRYPNVFSDRLIYGGTGQELIAALKVAAYGVEPADERDFPF